MKKIILSSYLMMITLLISAQTQGLVSDSDNNPIDKVSVFLAEQKILLNTNEDGIFVINQEIPNNSYIHFYKLGYASKIIQHKHDAELKVILEELHISLDEVGVTESFSELGNNKLLNIDKKSLKHNFIKSNSVAENISQLSGVDVISSGLGIQKLVVRGLSGMRVVTYLNGMKIENQQWANDHGLGFTDLGLNEVELIKGASALKYGGEAVGGLLYFKDDPFIATEKLHGFLATKFDNSSHLFSNQIGLKWNRKNFYFNFYSQYSISSDYRLPNNQYLFNSRFRKKGVKLSIAHRSNNWQNIFRYQYNGEEVGIPAHSHSNPQDVNLEDITSNSFNIEHFKLTRPNQFIDNQLLIYESNYFLNAFKFDFHFGHFTNHLQEFEKWTKPAFDMNLSNTQFKSNVRYQRNELTINIGSQIGFLENQNNEEERLVPDANTNDIGVYSIIDYEKENIGFNGGIRHDYKHMQSPSENYDNLFAKTSYSSAVYYKFNNRTVRLTYSGAFRVPHFSELFSNGLHHGTNRYEVGSKELTIEKGHQFDFKYQWSNNHFGLVINPFLQHITDFIAINPTDSFYQNSYRIYHYTQFSKVELAGIEMSLHYHPHQLHNLHFEQSYSFLSTRNYDSEYGLALIPANNIRTKAIFYFNEFDKLLKYSLNALSISHLYTFEQSNFSEYESLTKAYNVLNIQLDFNLNKRFDFVLGVNNLLNEEYSPHISRIREVAGGVPNPGRSFYINCKYEF